MCVMVLTSAARVVWVWQALSVNEFRSCVYSAPVAGIGTLGESFLRNKGTCQRRIAA
jgi:hypothetical protein